jgi:hypothetical protein
MGFFDSSISDFDIDRSEGGALLSIRAYITEIDGLPGGTKLNDVTAIGATSESTHPSIQSASISLSGNWDDTATTGPDAILGVVFAAPQSQTLTFEYGPEGLDSTDIKYSGECWIEDYKAKSSVGNQVTWSATLRVTGGVTRAVIG